MNGYYRLIPRLNGEEIEDRLPYYLGLVKKGIAGFILFGGELRTVREGLRRLQEHADGPLIIASDLEQGLGQQVQGGTLFPPAMAIGALGSVVIILATFLALGGVAIVLSISARAGGFNGGTLSVYRIKKK